MKFFKSQLELARPFFLRSLGAQLVRTQNNPGHGQLVVSGTGTGEHRTARVVLKPLGLEALR